MNDKYIMMAYELYRQDVANTTTTPMTLDQFKASLNASCNSKKINWLPYFLGGAALVYLLKK